MVVQGDFTTLTDYQGTSPSPVHPHYVQCILLPTAWGNHSPTYPAAAAYSITNNKNNAIPNIMLSVSYKMQFIGQSEHNGIRIRGQTKALHCQHSKQKVRILLSRSVNCKPSWAQFHIRHFFLGHLLGELHISHSHFHALSKSLSDKTTYLLHFDIT